MAPNAWDIDRFSQNSLISHNKTCKMESINDFMNNLKKDQERRRHELLEMEKLKKEELDKLTQTLNQLKGYVWISNTKNSFHTIKFALKINFNSILTCYYCYLQKIRTSVYWISIKIWVQSHHPSTVSTKVFRRLRMTLDCPFQTSLERKFTQNFKSTSKYPNYNLKAPNIAITKNYNVYTKTTSKNIS